MAVAGGLLVLALLIFGTRTPLQDLIVLALLIFGACTPADAPDDGEALYLSQSASSDCCTRRHRSITGVVECRRRENHRLEQLGPICQRWYYQLYACHGAFPDIDENGVRRVLGTPCRAVPREPPVVGCRPSRFPCLDWTISSD